MCVPHLLLINCSTPRSSIQWSLQRKRRELTRLTVLERIKAILSSGNSNYHTVEPLLNMKTYRYGGCSIPILMKIYLSIYRIITDTFGEQCFDLYTEVVFVERLFCTQTVHLGPGCLAVIIIATGLYSEVVVNMQRFHCNTCTQVSSYENIIHIITYRNYFLMSHPKWR